MKSRKISTSPVGPLLLAAVLFWPLNAIRMQLAARRPLPNIAHAPLYLPQADTVRLVTLGFNSFAADLLWFSTINYFGKEFQDNGRYEWFAHRCRLVTDLHPKSIERFEFCATLLSWIAKDPAASNDLLGRAATQYPEDWHLLYLRAFNSFYFLNDGKSAAADMEKASRMPDFPPALASLAARLLSSQSDPQLAVDFLTDSIRRTADPTARHALEERLKQARLTRDLAFLNRAMEIYRERYSLNATTVEDLARSGIISGIPEEPFGGKYEIDGDHVRSTSGNQGLSFSAETPQTKAAKNDN